MQLNGIGIKPRRKARAKVRKVLAGRCRWESASHTKSSITLHRQLGMAIARAAQLHGFVRPVSYQPDGIVQHGQWRRV